MGVKKKSTDANITRKEKKPISKTGTELAIAIGEMPDGTERVVCGTTTGEAWAKPFVEIVDRVDVGWVATTVAAGMARWTMDVTIELIRGAKGAGSKKKKMRPVGEEQWKG